MSTDGPRRAIGGNAERKMLVNRKQHPLYWMWLKMRHRCSIPSIMQYKDYGGHGIRVCDRWREDFWAFVADMGERPPGATIERIDNDGNYEPANCRWATRREQCNNKRNNRLLTFRGETLTMSEIARKYGLTVHNVYQRLRAGWPIDRALLEPKQNAPR